MDDVKDQVRKKVEEWLANFFAKFILIVLAVSLILNGVLGFILRSKQKITAAQKIEMAQLVEKNRALGESNEMLELAKAKVIVRWETNLAMVVLSTNNLRRGEQYFSDPSVPWRAKYEAYRSGLYPGAGSLK